MGEPRGNPGVSGLNEQERRELELLSEEFSAGRGRYSAGRPALEWGARRKAGAGWGASAGGVCALIAVDARGVRWMLGQADAWGTTAAGACTS